MIALARCSAALLLAFTLCACGETIYVLPEPMPDDDSGTESDSETGEDEHHDDDHDDEDSTDSGESDTDTGDSTDSTDSTDTGSEDETESDGK